MDHHAAHATRDDKGRACLAMTKPPCHCEGAKRPKQSHNEKVDSSVKVDRHADKSARDDRETRNATNLNTAQDSRKTPEF